MRAKVIFASPTIIIAPHRQETSILGYLASEPGQDPYMGSYKQEKLGLIIHHGGGDFSV